MSFLRKRFLLLENTLCTHTVLYSSACALCCRKYLAYTPHKITLIRFDCSTGYCKIGRPNISTNSLVYKGILGPFPLGQIFKTSAEKRRQAKICGTSRFCYVWAACWSFCAAAIKIQRRFVVIAFYGLVREYRNNGNNRNCSDIMRIWPGSGLNWLELVDGLEFMM